MEKNQNERKWLGILIWVVFAFITFAISYKIYNDVQSRGKKEIEKPVEKHEVEEPVPPQMDSTYTDLVEVYTLLQFTKLIRVLMVVINGKLLPKMVLCFTLITNLKSVTLFFIWMKRLIKFII
jgi:hypothetical protein